MNSDNKSFKWLPYFLIDLLPATFVMWQRFVANGNQWTWKILLLSFHPFNMVIWPLVAAFKPSEKTLSIVDVS